MTYFYRPFKSINTEVPLLCALISHEISKSISHVNLGIYQTASSRASERTAFEHACSRVLLLQIRHNRKRKYQSWYPSAPPAFNFRDVYLFRICFPVLFPYVQTTEVCILKYIFNHWENGMSFYPGKLN